MHIGKFAQEAGSEEREGFEGTESRTGTRLIATLLLLSYIATLAPGLVWALADLIVDFSRS